MTKACELNPSTMAAVLGLADEKVESVSLRSAKRETGAAVVAAANGDRSLANW